VPFYFSPAGSEFAVHPSQTLPALEAQPEAIIRPQPKRQDKRLVVSNWNEFLEANYDLIKALAAKVCRYSRLSAQDIEDFQSDVVTKLIERDYQRLRDYRGESSWSTYLTTVFRNLLHDDLDKKRGKFRPSAQAERLGAVAVEYERLTIRDGYSFGQAFEVLRTNYEFNVSLADLEKLVAQLPFRTRRQFVSEDAIVDYASDDPSPDETAARLEAQVPVQRLRRALIKVIDSLDRQDRLILIYIYRDRLRVATVARVMKRNQKRLYVELNLLRERLRKLLEEQGFNHELVRELLHWDRQ
jgi:RNA polymerase sigma factor for flagellar operon FliA